MKRGLDTKPLTDDGHQQVHRHSDPDLALHGILREAIELLDAQMLLDPFEEQFHLPAVAVEFGDRGGGQLEVVGEEDQMMAIGQVLELDAPELLRVVHRRLVPGEHHGLVADDARFAVAGRGVQAPQVRVGLGPRDEKYAPVECNSCSRTKDR